jgi:hypothetical protein
MLTRNRQRRSFLAAGRVVCAVAAAITLPSAPARAQSDIDLSGTWSYALVTADGGREILGTIDIAEDGGSFTGDWSELSRSMQDEFGFQIGERVLEATAEGAILSGRLRLNYGVSNREACPDQWRTWGDIQIALPKTRGRLDGRFRSSAISPQDCTSKDEGWRYFELTPEVTEGPTGDPTPPEETGVLAESSFDGGADDWTISVEDGTTGVPALQRTAGGNPGGYIEAENGDVASLRWEAPVSFLGDKSAVLGGVLLFDVRPGAASTMASDVRLEGGGSVLSLLFLPRPGDIWTTISLRIDAEAGWRNAATGADASETELRQVLSLLESLSIAAPPGSGLDNVVLSAGSTDSASAEASPAEPADAEPRRIALSLDEVSGAPGQALNLRVSLSNAQNEPVAADRLYRIEINADGAEVRPANVEIPAGGRASAARVYGARPGSVFIGAASAEGELETARAVAVTCAASPVTRIVLNALREEAIVGTPISAVLSLQNDEGVEVSGAPGNKRIRVQVEGVGRFASPGRDLIEDGRCATELKIAADRAGTSPVTVSLAALQPESRTFRFVLPWTHLGGALVFAALLGGGARCGQMWKKSQRWKLIRWAVTLAVGVVAGIAVYLFYALGLAEAIPLLPLGYAPALLLGIVGGYLGPAALERIAARVLPAP